MKKIILNKSKITVVKHAKHFFSRVTTLTRMINAFPFYNSLSTENITEGIEMYCIFLIYISFGFLSTVEPLQCFADIEGIKRDVFITEENFHAFGKVNCSDYGTGKIEKVKNTLVLYFNGQKCKILIINTRKTFYITILKTYHFRYISTTQDLQKSLDKYTF